MIEYLKPEGQYDIEVFNRNFKAVEDAMKYGRPLDWLNLPDVSKESNFKLVALLHLEPNAKNSFGFQFVHNLNDGRPLSQLNIDWGDGVVTTEADYASGAYVYYEHVYDFVSIEAPQTFYGDKQVIVTVTTVEEVPNITAIYPYISATYNGHGHYTCTSIVREMALQAAQNSEVLLYGSNMHNLRSIKMYNGRGAVASGAKSLAELVVDSPNLNYLNSSYTSLDEITIQPAPYTNLTFGTSALRIIKAEDLSQAASNPSFTNSRCLTNIILYGLKRKFTLTYAPMSREAFVDLFKSLGTADSSLSESDRTLSLTTCAGYSDLTEEDIKIVTDKGFIWT